MRKVILVLAAFVSGVSPFAVAETIPPGIQFTEARQSMSVMEAAQWNAIYQKNRNKTYVDGIRRVKGTPAAGTWHVPMVSAKVVFDATGLTGVRQSRTLIDGKNDASREGIQVYLDGVSSSFNLSPLMKGWTFLAHVSYGTAWIKYLPTAAFDRVEADCKTDLAQAEFVYSLKRSDVIDQTGKFHPDNMTWTIVGPLQLTGTNDQLTRYDFGDIVIFAATKPDQKQGWFSVRIQGYVFRTDTGACLGDLAGAIQSEDKPVTPDDVEHLLARIRLPS